MRHLSKHIILAAALAVPLIASAGIKTTNIEDVSIPVSYSGYDLKTVAGKEMVERKIKQAAHEICGSTDFSQSRSLRQAKQNQVCFDDAVANAMNGLEKLTAVLDGEATSTGS
jgi:UrcA family protein